MASSRGRLGDSGEGIARRYLEGRGYQIFELNYRCPFGEVDIVAQEGGCLVFVEVRTRRSLQFGTPEESVSRAKQRKLITTALTYLQSCQPTPELWRIDLISIRFSRGDPVPQVDHLRYAVQAGDEPIS